MPSASTGVSLPTIYRIENSIIYTYALGQIYLGFLQLIAVENDRPKTGSPVVGPEMTTAAAESPVRPWELPVLQG
ncbi:hypothetical protein D3C72_2001010 [compost metagenome]